ncbi:MAG: hypothetical protein JEY71_12525 [Sphaerochaeta sp.]|nr:hypothetical protein [Sphaerochaeta sp.]
MVRHATKKTKIGISYSVSLPFTLSCWGFTLFLLWGLVLNTVEGVSLLSMWHLVLLLLFSLTGALFRDSWVFDTEMREVRSFYGIGPVGKREVIPFSEVSHLSLEHFVRGATNKDAKPTKRRFKAMVVFTLCLKDESSRDIEIIPESTSGGRTEAAVQAIAAVSGLPLYIDRPRDLDLQVGLRDPD